MTQRHLSYEIVMATRNRPEAVALSLPAIMLQTRPPARVVIVDSSDDGGPIAALAETGADRGICPVDYMRAGAGSAYQRNFGLKTATADVVIFPDDDSLLYPDAAERMMEVYEADRDGAIAAVCAAPMDGPPPLRHGSLESYAADVPGPARLALRAGRQLIKEGFSFGNPFLVVGNRLNGQHRLPDWFAKADVMPVPYMTGFRMSFRRNVIAPVGFDEILRRYSWFEDIDASFAAMQRGLVVQAGRAGIYHHRVAGARDNGFRMGYSAILNRGYVVMKHVRGNPDIFRNPDRQATILEFYCRARAIAYAAMARDTFGRDRLKGARQGLAGLSVLTRAARGELADLYARLERMSDPRAGGTVAASQTGGSA